MKKILCIIAVLLAFVLVLAPKAPDASAAGTAPGKEVSLTFDYADVAGLNGKFTFSNPAIIDGDVSYSWTSGFDGDVSNNLAFFSVRSAVATKPLSVTVSFAISDAAQNGETCEIAFAYEIYDLNGDMSASGTDRKTVTVEVPETQPTTQPTQPTTQPTQPETQPTQPTQPVTRPTTPVTQPTVPTQPETLPTVPTQPETQPTEPTLPVTQPTQPTEDNGEQDRTPVSSDEDDDSSCNVGLIIILVLLLIIIALIILLILAKKKRNTPEE